MVVYELLFGFLIGCSSLLFASFRLTGKSKISCDLILEVVSGGRIITVLSFPDSSIPFFLGQQNMFVHPMEILDMYSVF